MAHITLAGILRDPVGELAVGDEVRFTHRTTTGETIQGSVKSVVIAPDGSYSIDLQYGEILVEYKDFNKYNFESRGIVVVNGDSTATSIPELLNATVPVIGTDLLQFQSIQADCKASRDEAEAFAATLDLVNDLSQAYEFPTVAEYKSFATGLPDGKQIRLLDRGATFTKISGIATANELNIIASDNVDQSIEINKRAKMTLESLGVVDEAGFNVALTYSNDNDVELSGKVSFELSSRIDLPKNFKLKSKKGDIVITASAGYFSGAEFAMIYGDAVTAIEDSYLEGVTCIGGLTDYTNDGTDRYGIRIAGCTNTSIRYCRAETLERGIFIRDGASGGEIAYCSALDCFNQGVGYIGTNASPITDVELHHNKSEKSANMINSLASKSSGIRTEEVYDSKIYNNKAHKHYAGIRIENSCDNEIYNNKGWECDGVGGQLYNFSQRNSVYGNSFFDNNVLGSTDTSLTPDGKGNADIGVSGFELQNAGNNNNIFGNRCFQTQCTTFDFNSGSIEPSLGDVMTGQTSASSGIVRLIELDSGTWAGGDATGVLHLVTEDSFANPEQIDNTTTATLNVLTTSGDTEVGASIGQQRYGIGINIRNIQGADGRDAFNLIYGNQCFNNSLGAVEDRGFSNDVHGNTDNNFHQTIVRNT